MITLLVYMMLLPLYLMVGMVVLMCKAMKLLFWGVIVIFGLLIG